jgi:hypothetical protein
MRRAIYFKLTDGGVALDYLPVPEARERFKADILDPPAGAKLLEVWESDNGVTRRKRFSEGKIADDPGKSFDAGNKELVAQLKENQRRSMEGLPSLEEEAALNAAGQAALAAKLAESKARRVSENELRKTQRRPSLEEEQAAAHARTRAQDEAETKALRAHENSVRKAQGRPSLEEEDAMIEAARNASQAAKFDRLKDQAKAQLQAKAQAEAEFNVQRSTLNVERSTPETKPKTRTRP